MEDTIFCGDCERMVRTDDVDRHVDSGECARLEVGNLRSLVEDSDATGTAEFWFDYYRQNPDARNDIHLDYV